MGGYLIWNIFNLIINVHLLLIINFLFKFHHILSIFLMQTLTIVHGQVHNWRIRIILSLFLILIGNDWLDLICLTLYYLASLNLFFSFRNRLYAIFVSNYFIFVSSHVMLPPFRPLDLSLPMHFLFRSNYSNH